MIQLCSSYTFYETHRIPIKFSLFFETGDETDGETECNAVDKNQDCYKLKKHCTSSQYKEYMKTNCAKTCSICQGNNWNGYPV